MALDPVAPRSTPEPAVRFRPRPPSNISELKERAESLAGLRLGDVAEQQGVQAPRDLRRDKGWVGQLLERQLGASAGCRAEPDFPALGIELKSLPVDHRGHPLESTFVCSIELSRIADCEWEESRLLKKLSHVLFIPVEGLRTIPVPERRIGTPIFWRPEAEEWEQLKADWERLSGLIAHGRTSEITAHLGDVLQVRPKARRGSSTRRATDQEGLLYDEQPKGFYLRAGFTSTIVKRHLRAA